MTRSERAQVLVVGAGPTGLVLALWLAKRGIRVRIIDKTAEPGTTSRAIAVQARTLEWYRALGLADDVVERGLRFAAMNFWSAGKKRGRLALGDIGKGLSRYPYVLAFPQDQHERLLIDHLSKAGVEIEHRTELVHFGEIEGGVRAQLKRADGSEEFCEAEYLAGCDGAHSKVRDVLGVEFAGGAYAHLFYVADVNMSGALANGELHIALDGNDFLAVFPLRGEGYARLIGTVRAVVEDRPHDLGWDDVSRRIFERLPVAVERVNWFSTYHVSHRVASRFRSGRAFLVGDAAHIHSPVGGQGMNTGIGDAVNLAWKLAAVLRRQTAPGILDTYETERIDFARLLVATTDRIFGLITSGGSLAKRVRTNVVPRVLPSLFQVEAFRRYLFKTVSQVKIEYRTSRLSEGRAGAVHAGDRLPWLELDGGDNYAPLTTLGFQVHVYGDCNSGIVALCRKLALPLDVFAWQARFAKSGLRRDAVYLVRPDGYVGFADEEASPRNLEHYLESWASPQESRTLTLENNRSA